MRCYFLKAGRLAGVEVLPDGLSDEEAITKARALLSKRKGPFDSFEVWEGSRYVFRERLPTFRHRLLAEAPGAEQPQARPPNGGEPQSATSPPSPAAERP
jgi:hypothetical protein